VALARGRRFTGRPFLGKLTALCLAAICWANQFWSVALASADLVARGYSIEPTSKLLAQLRDRFSDNFRGGICL
jgi:hypothetical protein